MSTTFLLALHAAASIPAQLPSPAGPEDPVLAWNEVTLEAIRSERTPPPLAARNLAIVHAAVFDALNGVQRTYRAYRVEAAPAPGTSEVAAGCIAAHRALMSLYPAQAARFDAVLDRTLAAVPDGPAKGRGVALGLPVAEAVLAARAGDGAGRRSAYPPGDGPGAWRPTPPDFRPALLPHWGTVPGFAMSRGDQLRPPPPPPLTSAAYTEAFREVKRLGGKASADRTREQTEIAHFWADGDGTVTPPGHWNRIAQTVSRQRGLSTAENARLFALLNIALADAAVACWDGKFHYNFWRPVLAIREADRDGNPDTDPDPTWEPLLPTPPFPAYASGHSTFSGAAAAVLAAYFGTDAVPFTSGSDGLPGVVRSFAGFRAAAEEAGMSRIYGGIHWQFDNREGLTCGRAVGEFVARTRLLPRNAVEAAKP
jgi:membrane-associated phospholipid phosphatase